MDRHPSSSRTSPSAWMISGFASTIFASGFFPVVTSTTATRRVKPICGAAKPTPCAAYMEANMSSVSCSNSASNFFTVTVGFSRMGSPYLTILYILRAAAVASMDAGACVGATSELVDLSDIIVEIPPHLRKGISSKFLQKSIRQHKCDHRFSGHCPRGDDAPVRALVSCRNGFFGHHVSRMKCLAQRRNGFQVAAYDDIFPVGDAAFEATRTVCRPSEAPRSFFVGNFVLNFAAVRARRSYARADLNRLDGLHAHKRLRKPPVEFFVPLSVTP